MCSNSLTFRNLPERAHVGVCVYVQVTAVTSELSDERFRGDAVGQALDVERAERLRLSRENKELQVGGAAESPPVFVIASPPEKPSAAPLKGVSVLSAGSSGPVQGNHGNPGEAAGGREAEGPDCREPERGGDR